MTCAMIIECDSVDVEAKVISGNIPKAVTVLKVYLPNEESLMENLNFEDVMNYYGVTKVGEWAEANR